MEIVTNKDPNYEIMLNPATVHSFHDDHPPEPHPPTKPSPLYEEIDASHHTSHYELDDQETEKRRPQYMSVLSDGPQQTSHYELDDEETGKKGEDVMPLYTPILDGPTFIPSPPTTTNSTTDS